MGDEDTVSVLREAIETLLAAHTRHQPGEPELARVRAAGQVRTELAEAGETVVDEAIAQARRRSPTGHTLGEIGVELSMSSQAVGQRIRRRGLDADRIRQETEPRAARARRKRAEQSAFVRAGMRWRGRALREVTDEHGRLVGVVPAHGSGQEGMVRVHERGPRLPRRARTDETAPVATTPQPPQRGATPQPRGRPAPPSPTTGTPHRRQPVATAYERAQRAAGATVFRPQQVRRQPPSEPS